MKIRRRLNFEQIRRYCIEKDLYTKGTNEDYMILAKFIFERGFMEDDDILAIAENIKDKSDTLKSLEEIIFDLVYISTYFLKMEEGDI